MIIDVFVLPTDQGIRDRISSRSTIDTFQRMLRKPTQKTRDIISLIISCPPSWLLRLHHFCIRLSDYCQEDLRFHIKMVVKGSSRQTRRRGDRFDGSRRIAVFREENSRGVQDVSLSVDFIPLAHPYRARLYYFVQCYPISPSLNDRRYFVIFPRMTKMFPQHKLSWRTALTSLSAP
ncbi:hypothetical protein BN2476_630135 [Paraburkholderia piptadeniae]|uniref:Uncharacterized protein n=1 Tax=Paraburkholderia piptadeniae TaxID=1701573 RepID=A0A1N7SLV1_9BURK|nr:hypothetical protein BN2476_630135 [Paraburkholderia piptadeniae]